MSTILVLAPANATDPVLVRARWVADANARRLAHEGHVVQVERSFKGTPPLPDDADGVAYFGHGSADGIADGDGRSLFGGASASALSRKWLHAFACEAAETFGPRVIGAGVCRFAGYSSRLTPNWDATTLTDAARALGERVVSSVTASLASGAAEPRIRDELREAVDALFLELDRDPTAEYGEFLVFCQSQVENLVVLSPPPRQ